jgi:hypothetical protein
MTPATARADQSDHVLDFVPPDKAKTIGAELARTTESLARQLEPTIILDTASLEHAVRDRQDLGGAIARVEAFFAPLKKMAYDLHRALCTRENEILAPLQRVDRLKREAISAYKAEQDRLREAEERRLAELQRQADEARAAAEAAALERTGDHAMAAAVLEEAITRADPVVVLPDRTRQVDGLSFVRRWLWRYSGGPTDLKQTPPAILARSLALVPREFLCVDVAKVSAHVRAHKGSAKIPGIQIFYVDDPRR